MILTHDTPTFTLPLDTHTWHFHMTLPHDTRTRHLHEAEATGEAKTITGR